MTDIVFRLQHPDIYGDCGDDAIAEIERLRAELAVEKGWVEKYRGAYLTHVGLINDLRKEYPPPSWPLENQHD
jgi:hypothetical protein